MRKLKFFLIILCSVVAAALVVLAALTYIPLTRTLEYDMHGYIIQPDGQIVEQFPFTVTYKDYDFIIDPPGQSIQFAGDKLTKIERDAFLIYFNFDSAPFAKNFEPTGCVGNSHPKQPQILFGSIDSYNPNKDQFDNGVTMLNLEDGSCCMYMEGLLENAFVVGISNSDTDPADVLEYFVNHVKSPNLPSIPES